MTIGILQCGAPPEALIAGHGTYGTMIQRLLGPGRRTAIFDVTRGEPPESATARRAYVLTESPAGVP